MHGNACAWDEHIGDVLVNTNDQRLNTSIPRVMPDGQLWQRSKQADIQDLTLGMAMLFLLLFDYWAI